MSSGIAHKKAERLTMKKGHQIEHLESLLSFANKNIQRLDSDGLESQVIEYARLVAVDSVPFLAFVRIHAALTSEVGSWHQETGLDKVKSLLSSLQTHLRSRIESIIHAVSWSRSRPLLDLDVQATVAVDVEKDTFVSLFQPENGIFDEGIDLESHKLLLDSRLMNLFIAGGLSPSRFRLCENCGGFFYQKTERMTIYCSRRCAKTAAQRKYTSRKERNPH